ncbi:hypothetical protein ABIA39_003601 [Nocardia sp. GAS34]|uniref:hypothetical protein n=1 Tax=unclassified Nocardia TaxID=2637762 RepID=UPI003D1F14BE
MAVHRPTAANKWLLRTGSLLVIGSIPVSAGWSHPAVAVANTPAAPVVAVSPHAPAAPRTPATRPMPGDALAPIDPTTLHLPDRAAPVLPIQAPAGTLRIGSVVVPRPGIIDAPTGDQINTASANAEAGLAQGLDSVGFAQSRSDRIAADTLGGAATGAVVGSTLASPLAVTSAVVGAVAGLIAGVPFLPAGLVVVPVIGAAIGYGVIAAPAAAAGAAVGAAVGGAQGMLTPPTGPDNVPAPRAH